MTLTICLEVVCIRLSGNILANGKLYFRVLKLYFEIIDKNVICADS